MKNGLSTQSCRTLQEAWLQESGLCDVRFGVCDLAFAYKKRGKYHHVDQIKCLRECRSKHCQLIFVGYKVPLQKIVSLLLIVVQSSEMDSNLFDDMHVHFCGGELNIMRIVLSTQCSAECVFWWRAEHTSCCLS